MCFQKPSTLCFPTTSTDSHGKCFARRSTPRASSHRLVQVVWAKEVADHGFDPSWKLAHIFVGHGLHHEQGGHANLKSCQLWASPELAVLQLGQERNPMTWTGKLPLPALQGDSQCQRPEMPQDQEESPCRTRMSGHIIQWPLPKAAMCWQVKKVSSFLTSGVSISYHSIFSMCIALKAPILAPSAFGMDRFHFRTQCFWLSTHCFSYMQALHASWTCCFWIFASNLLVCTNLSSSEMQSHHGQWADWMAFAWKSKADFHVVHTNKSNGFVICGCQDNHYSHQMQKIMHHSDEICYFTFFLQQVYVPTKTLYVKGFHRTKLNLSRCLAKYLLSELTMLST